LSWWFSRTTTYRKKIGFCLYLVYGSFSKYTYFFLFIFWWHQIFSFTFFFSRLVLPTWRWKSMDCINSRRYVTTTGMENKHYTISNGLVWFGSMVLNAIFNNISVISWRPVFLGEETEVPGENHRSIASNWQTLSHNVVHQDWILLIFSIRVIFKIHVLFPVHFLVTSNIFFQVFL
jgi:hypothetical protein